MLGRGLLRQFLGTHLRVDPAALRFEKTAAGKPRLPDGPAFNISHSGRFVLVAIANAGRVGVDVEAVRPLDDLDRLAERTFAPDELEGLRSIEPGARLRPFYRLWSRKEAVLKALGVGISALESISVSLEPDVANAIVRLTQPGEDVAGWTVRPIACGPDVEAAVAWDHEIREVVMTDGLVG